MYNYTSQRAWSDRFMPQVKQIVGPLCISVSNTAQDIFQATDLVTLEIPQNSIAVRIRRHRYSEEYPYEFTLRCRAGNNLTESHKIMSGWGHSLFYGFANEQETEISRWHYINLYEFRYQINYCKNRLSFGRRPNKDGTELAWFDLRSFDPKILISSSHPIPFTKI